MIPKGTYSVTRQSHGSPVTLSYAVPEKTPILYQELSKASEWNSIYSSVETYENDITCKTVSVSKKETLQGKRILECF